MKKHFTAWLGACLFCLSAVWVAAAEEAGPPPVLEGADKLSKQLLGYWIVDFESAVTKAFLVEMGDDETVREEMTNTTFEFQEAELKVHMVGEADEVIQITLKAEDPEKRTITAEFLAPGQQEPSAMLVQLEKDRMTLSENDAEGDFEGFGLKRITPDEFAKRVRQNAKDNEPAADAPQKEEAAKDDYPTAKPVPDKPGFVFSPYDGQIIDIREIPSGTLVMDPHFDPKEKKMFRAP